MTEKAKPGFMVYHDKLAMLDKLPDDKFHAIMHAILVYSADRVMPEFDDPSLMVIFDMWKQMLDKDDASYVDKRKKAQAAANARWTDKHDADACETMQDDANACVSMPKHATACETMQNDACDATYQQSSINNQQSSVICHPSSVNNHGNGDTKSTVRTRTTSARFTPPSVDDVREFCTEKGYRIDAQHFIDYYEANGWRVGRNPMKDWRAALRMWASRDNGGTSPKTAYGNKPDLTQPDPRIAALEELKKKFAAEEEGAE